MKCPNCRFQNVADAKYCNECGTKLETSCQQCGQMNPPGSKFCNACGQGLSQQDNLRISTSAADRTRHDTSHTESIPSPDGERRQATIVFSDLSGYTSMNERLDPEEVEAIMSRIKREAVNIVERHEGIVNQFVGDEVLALFGVPYAHEDDPVRAVQAAMDIHRLVRQMGHEIEERIDSLLRMHTGISTGLIVTHMRD